MARRTDTTPEGDYGCPLTARGVPAVLEGINELENDQAALVYAELGVPIFPLHEIVNGACSCEKVNCNKPGKHPRTRHGFHDATADLLVVGDWWAKWPGANIGMPTGLLSGVVVLDGDGPVGIVNASELLPGTSARAVLQAATGGGGRHFVFTHPGGGVEIRNSVKETGWLGVPDVDVRGDGGYVVVAPSVTTGPYCWSTPAGTLLPWPLEVPASGGNGRVSGEARQGWRGSRDAWAALAALAALPQVEDEDFGALEHRGDACDRIRSAREGTRNHTLNTESWQLGPYLHKGELDFWGTAERLTEAALDSGLEEQEIFSTMASALGARAAAGELARVGTAGNGQPSGDDRQKPSAEDGRGAADRWFNGSAIFEVPAAVEAQWGEGDRVLWARNQSAFLVGPQGVGKTTIAGRITRGLMGLEASLLEFPITAVEGPVGYIAADRPDQILRSLRRMASEDERPIWQERFRLWKGPPDFDIGQHPEKLVEFAVAAGLAALVIDSLKDVALDLSKDEVGTRVNRALQLLLLEGIQPLVLHHPRKPQAGNKKPSSLADVYGSNWITAGSGSVVSLWGNPGDLIVEMSHLKQPAEQVGPLSILHNHGDGSSRVLDAVDLVELARLAPGGITAQGAAEVLFGSASRNNNEKARRRLDGLVKNERLERAEGEGENSVHYLPRGPRFG